MTQILQAGDPAPKFVLTDAGEEQFKLKDLLGRWVVLYFYPRDNTPGCTLEAIDFSRLREDFTALDTVIVGISKDSCQSHRKFAERHQLSLVLLSDPDSTVQKSYGVWRPKKFMGREFLGTVRSTFLIDPTGSISRVWDNVRADGHAGEVLAELKRQREQWPHSLKNSQILEKCAVELVRTVRKKQALRQKAGLKKTILDRKKHD
jgi:peroxiredoxin Q/BCP